MTSPLGKTLNLSEAALLGIPKLTLPAINQRSMQRERKERPPFLLPPLVARRYSTPGGDAVETRSVVARTRSNALGRVICLCVPRQAGGTMIYAAIVFAPSSLFVCLVLRETPLPERANARSASITHRPRNSRFPRPSRDRSAQEERNAELTEQLSSFQGNGLPAWSRRHRTRTPPPPVGRDDRRT